MTVTSDGVEHHGEVRATARDSDPQTNLGEDSWVLVQIRRAGAVDLLRWVPESHTTPAASDPTGATWSTLQLR